MKPRKINWGIIGAGKIARKFAKDLSTISNTKLYGIASRDIEKAKQFAQSFGADCAYGNYEELASNSNIDAVYIATPHSFHKAHTILCLKNKKAVLCEKPFAMNLGEVNEMVQLSKINKTLLMEAMWTAFLPHFRYVQNLINEKHFGKVIKLESDFGFYPEYNENSRVFDKSVGGGSLLDIGIYPVFAALSTLGKPNSIEAKAKFFSNGTDSQCDVVFSYDGTKAFLKSTLLEETKTEAIYTCEHGIIKINGRFHEPSSVTLTDRNGNKETKLFDCNAFGYNYEIEHFNQLIRDGKTESNIMPFELSRQLISVLDNIRNIIGLQYS